MKSSDLLVEQPETPDEVKVLLAAKLFEGRKVSLGKAAKMCGLSKRAFMEVLGRHRIPVFDYSPEELREEIRG